VLLRQPDSPGKRALLGQDEAVAGRPASSGSRATSIPIAKTQLSAIFVLADRCARWEWNSDRSGGQGNPCLSNELTALLVQAKRQDKALGRTGVTRACILRIDVLEFERKHRAMAMKLLQGAIAQLQSLDCEAGVGGDAPAASVEEIARAFSMPSVRDIVRRVVRRIVKGFEMSFVSQARAMARQVAMAGRCSHGHRLPSMATAIVQALVAIAHALATAMAVTKLATAVMASVIIFALTAMAVESQTALWGQFRTEVLTLGYNELGPGIQGVGVRPEHSKRRIDGCAVSEEVYAGHSGFGPFCPVHATCGRNPHALDFSQPPRVVLTTMLAALEQHQRRDSTQQGLCPCCMFHAMNGLFDAVHACSAHPPVADDLLFSTPRPQDGRVIPRSEYHKRTPGVSKRAGQVSLAKVFCRSPPTHARTRSPHVHGSPHPRPLP